ncbi:MAG: hypothetical protein HYU02_08030 [Thaumarchaeota archaeon]|nr:hypothetical protein [Nitrososphaerota archaeon]
MSREARARVEPMRKPLSAISELFPILDPRVIQSTVSNVLNTLNEPEFREEVKKTVELSYTTSLQIMQRFVKLSQDFTSLNREELTEKMNESVPELIKTNLSMAIELLTLNQKYSSMLLDILEKGAKRKVAKVQVDIASRKSVKRNVRT